VRDITPFHLTPANAGVHGPHGFLTFVPPA
jgi:hypothetical protein